MHQIQLNDVLFQEAQRRAAEAGFESVDEYVAEVLKHPGIEAVYLLELDEEVVQVSRKHYDVARDALADPRVDVLAGDAFDSIGALSGRLDAILVDLTDPIGPAARLFEDGFYALCESALRDSTEHPGG